MPVSRRRPAHTPGKADSIAVLPVESAEAHTGFFLGTAHSNVEVGFLLIFLTSTPVAVMAVYFFGGTREWWALANSYAFSTAYCLLYLWPLLGPRKGASARQRLDAAMRNWIVWLTCFTQLIFQVPHNVLTSSLRSLRGSMFEWPFYSYALSDSRWTAYETEWPDGRVGLPPEVWLINVNDATLGLLVLCAYVAAHTARLNSPLHTARRRHLLLIVIVTIRDATLFRETVEYMWLQHHLAGYPFTTQDPRYRPHAIACLWLVNVLWLIAPVLTARWAWLGVRGHQ